MTAARDITLIYGSRTVGSTTTNVPDGQTPIRITSSFEEYTVEFDFIVTDDLDTEIAALENDFSKRRETLTLTFGGSTRTFSSGAGTGFESRAELVKRGDDADTGNTRFYTARITVQRPADDEDGLLEASIELGYDESRHRSVTISGIYTATPTHSTARAAYDADISSYQSGILSGFGGTWNILTEVTTTDDKDTRLEFTRELLEVKYSESSGALDVASIVNQQLSITSQATAGEFSPGPFGGGTMQPPVLGTATYEASIDFTVTTALADLWRDTILPWLDENIRAVLEIETLTMIEVSPTFDFPSNRITATVVFEGLVLGVENVLEYTLTIGKTLQTGKTLVPVWVRGSAFSKYIFQGPAREILKATQTTKTYGRMPTGEYGFPLITTAIDDPSGGGAGEWILVEDDDTVTPFRRGIMTSPGDTSDYWLGVRTQTYERAGGVGGLVIGEEQF